MVMFVIFASVLVLMLLGVTTAVTMGFASAATFLLAGGDMARLFLVPQRMFAQVSGITLMSIPFFLLMGNLMTEGGVSKSLFAFGRVSLGHRWGGLSNAAIAACIVMAAMSGSAAACAAGIGMIAVAEMKKSGYGEAFSCATIAAGGALGPIIPPSITLILYAGLTQTSVNALFAAGAVPGLIIGFAFMLWSSCVCRMKGYAKTQAAPWRERWYAFKEAFFALLTPVIVIGGMFAGLFTATEAAAVASFYVMILGFFVFKTLKVKDLPKIFWATAEQTAKVMFVIATAGFFQYVLLYTRIPQEAIAFISTSFTSIVPVLLIIIALLVIMGCFMEGTAILLITVPIFVPLAKAFGFDVVQLGIVMCISLAVGVLTPPVGLNLYVMASISGVKVMAIAREALGYVLIMILGAAAVAFIPELSLGLARLVP
ncbi:MAG: TRAP transporter large permease [Sutterella sp.]|jgi:TRAP transporter, dctM subunit|uniref:TRAP transporter large permease n=1 Tax=Duodenibacillus massiliensis TaxID=1852381 RepID=UPI000EECB16F|nr:TRAP transporter large permease [uncultured Duodenibacillus sp.]MBE5701807.1 TRAP transporter large permease [Sutterella sp.]HAF64675.1 TRAP transporter large permease [Sutterella sp.]